MPQPPLFLSHPSSLDHDTAGHPESAARIVAIESELAAMSWLGYERVGSPEVAREVLELIHPPRYIESIERIASAGGGYLDADTIMSSGSFAAALHAAGGAVEMVARLAGAAPGERTAVARPPDACPAVAARPPDACPAVAARPAAGPAVAARPAAGPAVAFSVHRPPGHHALPDRAMGFCLFNSIAVAAAFATRELGLRRVLILDWDVHHGNGTNDIFLGSDEVLFVSIHQSPLYPGTGPASELGTGSGRGYTVNLPVPPGSGDDLYLSLVRHVVEPLALVWKPQLVLVSAGFDAHDADPLASCTVTEAGFAGMAAAMRDLCATLAVPLGCVLEGGYNTTALARSVAATMRALGDAEIQAPSGPVSPLAAAALERLSPFWPALDRSDG